MDEDNRRSGPPLPQLEKGRSVSPKTYRIRNWGSALVTDEPFLTEAKGGRMTTFTGGQVSGIVGRLIADVTRVQYIVRIPPDLLSNRKLVAQLLQALVGGGQVKALGVKVVANHLPQLVILRIFPIIEPFQ